MKTTNYEKRLTRDNSFPIAHAIIDDTTVDGTMIALYAVFLRFSKLSDDGLYGTDIGIRKMADLTGFSKRKVQYGIKRLEHRGLVKRHRKMLGNTVTEMVDNLGDEALP